MLKYFKKVKKDKLVDFIKLINEDLLKNNKQEEIIDESITKNKMLEQLGFFLTNPDNLDIAQKYINYLDEERKMKLISQNYENISQLNNKFFILTRNGLIINKIIRNI